jgi:integrase
MYSKAIEWGRTKENPAKKVKFLKGAVKRVRFLMADEVQRLLSSCNDELRPVVTVAIHTGMRKGELLGLQRPQVNFEQGLITLFDTKNHERRDIPMNETVKTTLAALPERGDYFFCDRNGKRLGYTKIAYSFHAALARAGIQDFRFHDCRHTFASSLVMAGEDLNTVAELLGHKGLEMTRRYAHLSPKFKKRAVNILDRIMSLNPPQPEMAEKGVSLMS